MGLPIVADKYKGTGVGIAPESATNKKPASPSLPHRALSLVAFTIVVWFFFLKMLDAPYFFDGITYGAVAQNLALNHQGYWNLTYTDTIFPTFVEHPPLFFWLLHLSFFLPKLPFPPEVTFNLFLLAAALILLQRIWLAAQPERSVTLSAWIPLSLFMATPILREAFTSALIDNLLCVFNLLAVLLLLRAENVPTKKAALYFVGVGITAFLSILSKGPVGLYPLLASALFVVFFKDRRRRWLGLWLPITVTAILLGVLCLNENAGVYLSRYFNKQVISSLFGARSAATVKEWGHFYLLKTLVSRELIPLFFCCLCFVGLYFFRRTRPTPHDLKRVFFFLTLGVSGVVPLMVTAKQWPFYVVPALPFFILAVGFFVKQGFEDLLILFFRKKLLWRTGALILGLGIVSLTLINTQRYRSAPYYWEQWEVFFETIPEEVTLTTCPLLARDFSHMPTLVGLVTSIYF